MAKRNHREEIETALDGGRPQYMPFTAYEGYIPKSPEVRGRLMEMGLSVCCRQSVTRAITPNVELEVITESDGAVRAIHHTPVGDVWKLSRQAADGSWAPVEVYIKSKEDYKVAEFIFNDRRYEPVYDEFRAAQARIGDSGIVVGGTGYSPLLELQLVWFGQEQFCLAMADDPGAVLDLYEALCRSEQQMRDLAAASPARYVGYCGNIVPVMLGMDNIRQFVLPRWKAFADQLHAAGKKMGCHLDADNRLILDTIDEAGLDYLEAFTPPPDCSVSVEQARRELPGRALWINFPSSQHLCDDARIQAVTEQILQQAGDRRGVLLGVTEDVPAAHLLRSYDVILHTLRDNDS